MKHTTFPIETFGEPSEPSDLWEKHWRFIGIIVQSVIFLVAITSGVTTFDGAVLLNTRVGGVNFASIAYAGILAICVTSTIMCAWWVMMEVIPRQRGTFRIAAALVLLLALQGWTLAVSSSSNAISLGHKEALATHMAQTAQAFEATIAGISARSLAVKPRVSEFEGVARGRCLQAEGELKRGTLSDAPGKGGLTGVLYLLCAQSTETAQGLAASVETVEARADEVTKLLQDMNTVIWDTDKHIFERERRFLEIADEIKAWVRLSAGDDLASVLRTSLDVQAAALTPSSLASGSFGDKQRAIIEDLRAGVEQQGVVYKTLAAEIEAIPVPELPDELRISLKEAVWRAQSSLTIQIALAVGIDFFQLFMVLAFMLGRRQSAR